MEAVKLVPKQGKRSESAARILRALADKADAGEIESVVVIAFEPGGDFKVETSEVINLSEKIGLMFRAMITMDVVV